MKTTMKERYGVEHALQNENFQYKKVESNLRRFGVEHAAQADVVKEKTVSTNLERFGAIHPMLNEESKEQCLSRVRESNLETYGYEYPLQSPEIREKANNTIKERYNRNNISQISLSDEVISTLNDCDWLLEQNKTLTLGEIGALLGVSGTCVGDYMAHHDLIPNVFQQSAMERELLDFLYTHYNGEIIPNHRGLGFEIDIYLPELKLGIEVNGTYWHSELNGKSRKYHITKTKQAHDNGVHLIHIWEHEYIQHKDIVLSKLLYMVGKSKRYYARTTTVHKLTFTQVTDYLNRWHLQGGCASSINYGLFYKDECVAVMTFSKSRFEKNAQYELVRFANKLSSTVVGGFSKLLTHFMNEYSPNGIVSYSDKRWSKGDVYSRFFKYSHTTPPSYSYTANYSKVFHRMHFQKKSLPSKLKSFDITLTEWQNMQNNGYDRLWDCGNDVWITN